jgi:hypothetical protein
MGAILASLLNSSARFKTIRSIQLYASADEQQLGN